jgi:predicted phosphoribosyltransferase
MSDERRDSSAQGRRILVIADETVAGAALHQAIRFRTRNVAGDVLVVVPALGSLSGMLAPTLAAS